MYDLVLRLFKFFPCLFVAEQLCHDDLFHYPKLRTKSKLTCAQLIHTNWMQSLPNRLVGLWLWYHWKIPNGYWIEILKLWYHWKIPYQFWSDFYILILKQMCKLMNSDFLSLLFDVCVDMKWIWLQYSHTEWREIYPTNKHCNTTPK